MKPLLLCVAALLASVFAENSMSNPLPQLPSEGIRIWTIEDTQPPFIGELRGQKTQCVVTNGFDTWTYTVLASDLGAPSSGIADVTLAFWSPDFKKQSEGGCSPSGTTGVSNCQGFVDKWDMPGQWPLAWVNATDLQGNTASLAYDRTKNAAAYITVIGPEDTQPPELKFLQFYPNSLSIDNTTLRHQFFTVSANCTDNYSGCSSVRAVFLAPGSSNDPFLAVTKSFTVVLAWNQDYNVWSGDLTTNDRFVTRGQIDGDWTLYAVTASDAAGNFRLYYANEVAGLLNNGAQYSPVNVVGQPPVIPDPVFPAPQLISYSHDVSEIDLKLGDQRVCFNTTSSGDNYASSEVQHYIFLSGPTQTTVTCGPTYAGQPPSATSINCYRTRVVDPVNPTVPLNQTLLRHCIDFRTFTSHVRQGFYRIVGIGLRTPQGDALYGSCSGADRITNRASAAYCTNSPTDNLGCRPYAICGIDAAGTSLLPSIFIVAALGVIVALLH